MMAASLALLCLLVTALPPSRALNLSTQVVDTSGTEKAVDMGLQLSISPPAPVLGIHHEVSLTIKPAAKQLPDAAWAALVLRSSVGEIHDLKHEDGSTEWTARLLLPARRAPQGIIVAAQIGVGAESLAGAVIVPVSAVASPAFQTDPYADVTLLVGGRLFGPKRANAAGSVRVPVVVAPGTSVAVARSTNSVGKVAEEVLDLGVPPFPHWLVMAPKTAVHMRPFEVLVFGMNADASAATPNTIALATPNRRAQPLQSGAGWTRFLVTPPHLTMQTHMLVVASEAEDLAAKTSPETSPDLLHDDDSGPRTPKAPAARAEISLHAGPPAQLIMIPDRASLSIGSAQRLTLVVRAEDDWGQPTSTADTEIFVNGKPVGDVARVDGRLRIVVPAPRSLAHEARLLIEAIDHRAYARHVIVLNRNPAPQMAPATQAYPWAVVGRVGPSLGSHSGGGFGFSLEAQAQLSKWITWPQGLFLTSSLGYLARQPRIPSETGVSRLRLHLVPLLVGAAWHLQASRVLSFAMAIHAGTARAFVENDSFGTITRGTAWIGIVRLSADVMCGQGRTQIALGASFSDAPGGKLSSGDKVRGNMAGFAATLGVRQRW